MNNDQYFYNGNPSSINFEWDLQNQMMELAEVKPTIHLPTLFRFRPPNKILEKQENKRKISSEPVVSVLEVYVLRFHTKKNQNGQIDYFFYGTFCGPIDGPDATIRSKKLAGYQTWGIVEFFGLCTGFSRGYVEYADRQLHYNPIIKQESPFLPFSGPENFNYTQPFFNSYISEYIHPGLDIAKSGLLMNAVNLPDASGLIEGMDSVDRFLRNKYQFRVVSLTSSTAVSTELSCEEFVLERNNDKPESTNITTVTHKTNELTIREELIDALRNDKNIIHDPEFGEEFRKSVSFYQPSILPQSSLHLAPVVQEYISDPHQPKRRCTPTNKKDNPPIRRERLDRIACDEEEKKRKEEEFKLNGCITPSTEYYMD